MLLGINHESVPEPHQFVKRANVDPFYNFFGYLFRFFFSATLLLFPLFLLFLLIELLFVIIIFFLIIGLDLIGVFVLFNFSLFVRVLDAGVAVAVGVVVV